MTAATAGLLERAQVLWRQQGLDLFGVMPAPTISKQAEPTARQLQGNRLHRTTSSLDLTVPFSRNRPHHGLVASPNTESHRQGDQPALQRRITRAEAPTPQGISSHSHH